MTSQPLMLKVKTGLKNIPTVFADSTTAVETAHIRQFMKRKRGALIVTGFSEKSHLTLQATLAHARHELCTRFHVQKRTSGAQLAAAFPLLKY